MSKKAIAAIITACTIGLVGGGTGVVSLVNQHLSSPTKQPSNTHAQGITSNADDEQKLCEKLQNACEEKDLRGVWVSKAAVPDDHLVLTGVVDKVEQRALVVDKARAILREFPVLEAKCVKEPDAIPLVPISFRKKIADLQQRWSDTEEGRDLTEEINRQAKRQTRLDVVSFGFPNKLRVSGMCLAAHGNVRGLLETEMQNWQEWKKAEEAGGGVALTFDGSGIKQETNPSNDLQAAAEKQGQLSGLWLDHAWYDGNGQLRLRGVLSRESDQRKFQDLVKQERPAWEMKGIIRPTDGAPEQMQILDVQALSAKLQKLFANSKDKPLRLKTRIDTASFRLDPDRGLQLRFTGLCIASPPELPEKNRRLLETEIETAVTELYPNPPFTVSLSSSFEFKPNLVNELQKKVNDAELDIYILKSAVGFNENGKFVIHGKLPDASLNAILKEIMTEPMAPPGADFEEVSEETRVADNAPEFKSYKKIFPRLWEDMARNPKWRYIHIDSVKPNPSKAANPLEFSVVWLYDEDKPTEADKTAFTDYLQNKAKDLLPEVVPDFKGIKKDAFTLSAIVMVKSPIMALRSEGPKRQELEGAVFTDMCFAENGRLQVRGYIKGKKNGKKVDQDAEQLKAIAAVLMDPHLMIDRAAFGKRLAQGQEPDLMGLMPIDYSDFKLSLQKKLAARDCPMACTRIEKIVFRHAKEKKAPELFVKGECLQTKTDKVQEGLRKTLKDIAKAYLNSDSDSAEKWEFVDEIEFKDNPIPGIQKTAVDQHLDGILFEIARFNENGQMEFRVLCDKEQQSSVEDLLKNVPGEPKVQFGEPDWLPKGTKWSAVRVGLQAKLAAEDPKDEELPRMPLPRTTRVDQVFFAYDGPGAALRLHIKGVCIYDHVEMSDDKLREQLQTILTDHLKAMYPTLLKVVEKNESKQSVAIKEIEFKKVPKKEIQAAMNAAKPPVDGLIRKWYYDKDGKFQTKSGVDKDALKAFEEILREQLKGKGIYSPTPESSTEQGSKMTSIPMRSKEVLVSATRINSKDGVVLLDWKEILEDLRRQLAADRKNPLFCQTWVDGAEFQYADNDLTPHLRFQLRTLLPPGNKAVLRTKLKQRLHQYFEDALLPKLPGLEFSVQLPEDPFLPDPTPDLQRLAVATDHNLDGVLFEAAWYSADRHLNLDVLFDKTAGHEDKIKDLLAKNRIARKLLARALLPDDAAQEPRLCPRTFIKWKEPRQALQSEFAESQERLLQKTRVDRLYFDYIGNDTGDRRLRIEGVCLESGDAKKNSELLAKALADHWSARLPGVEFRGMADAPKVNYAHSDLTSLQLKIIAESELDGVYLMHSYFDKEGKLSLTGVWRSETQEMRLKHVVENFLNEQDRRFLSKNGFMFQCSILGTDKLLNQLRSYAADALDEVKIERLYFNEDGILTVKGYYAKPHDNDKIMIKLKELMREPEFKDNYVSFRGDEAPKDPLDKLIPRAPVIDHFRKRFQASAKKVDRRWDGILIKRCYYTPSGALGLEGVCDVESQKKELQSRERDLKLDPDLRDALKNGLDLTRLRLLPLAPMLDRIRLVMPAYEEFDGISLDSVYQDVKGKLFARVMVVGGTLHPRLEAELLRQLQAHEQWRVRVEGGFEFEVMTRQPRKPEIAEELVYRSISNFRLALRAECSPTYSCVPCQNVAAPQGFAVVCPQLPCVWIPTCASDTTQVRKYMSEAKRDADIALLHDPHNATAWYVRALSNLHQKNVVAAERDLRRMWMLEGNPADGSAKRAEQLRVTEALQGDLRHTISDLRKKVEQDIKEGRPRLTVAGSP